MTYFNSLIEIPLSEISKLSVTYFSSSIDIIHRDMQRLLLVYLRQLYVMFLATRIASLIDRYTYVCVR